MNEKISSKMNKTKDEMKKDDEDFKSKVVDPVGQAAVEVQETLASDESPEDKLKKAMTMTS